MKKLLNSQNVHHHHKHEKAIQINDLSFSYEKNKPILKSISMDIHRGEWTTILGPNGSGKSTLAKCISRIHKFPKGTITINGENVMTLNNKKFAQHVAYIPQIIDIPIGTSVYDLVSFGRHPWLGVMGRLRTEDKAIIESSMIKTGCWKWKDKMVEELSGGQRQKVIAAMAIAQDTEIIILDEPTTYLDIRAQYELLELINQLHDEGKTIIAILHDINQAVQYSDEVIIMKDGNVYDRGAPEKIVSSKMMKEVYKVETKFYTDTETFEKRKYITDIKLIK